MRFKRVTTLLGSVAFLLFALWPSGRLDAGQTLYHRLGGREGIRPLVNNFIMIVIKDPRVRMNSDAKKYLDRVNPSDLESALYDVLCEAAQGPCNASKGGIFMKNALRSMDLTPSDWNAVVSDFSAALVKFKIAASEQRELRQLMDRARSSAIP